MSTPDEECVLRDQAIEQIIQQIKQEFEEKGQPLPSQAVLLTMAKTRHDKQKFLT